MIIFKGFINGILTLFYLLIDNWYWVFGLIFFIGCMIVETLDVNEHFADDERQVL